MKRALPFLLALLVTPALPGVAGAHVEVSPTTAPAGKAVNLNFEVGHGCDGQATTGLEVLVPEGVASFEAKSIPGWKATNPGVKMVWKGGPLPDHDLQEFPFTARFFGVKGTPMSFRLIQKCENGASTAWIQKTPASGVEPETPAPVVTLTSSAGPPEVEAVPAETATGVSGATGDNAVDDPAATSADDVEKDEDDGINPVIPALAIGLVLSSLVAFVIYRGVKNKN